MKIGKNIFITSFIFLLSILIFGCKKVIDVKLNNTGAQTIITGEINNLEGPYKVTISKSVNFTADNSSPPVVGALVIISGNEVIDTLSELTPGEYFTKKIKGKPGQAYSLLVNAEGKIYTATSTMPKPVGLDSLSFLLGRNDVIYAVANFQDPPNVANYYQFIEYANGEQFGNGRGNLVFDDRLSDGRYISMALYDDSSDIKQGSTLTVQMNCIDKNVYTYLNELFQISGNGGGFSSPTPANPESNISGGALGYFSANTVTSKTVKLQ
ncbi:MAG: DUF4249 domain-containing protein [Ginsengibacter sp.]